MEKKIIILGRIGDTEFQNNDCCKVCFKGAASKCVKTVTNFPPMTIKKYEKENQSIRRNRENGADEPRQIPCFL